VVSTGDVAQAVELVGPMMRVIAVDLMNAAPPVVHPDDDLYATLALFRQHEVDALPVVERDTRAYVGVLSRAAILEALRARAAERGAQVLREHGSIAALAQEDQLAGLLSELPAYRRGTVQRMAVPPGTVGRSLREADFRNRFACEVIAVQKASGELQTPPDPGLPLSGDDVLIVVQKKKE
jgi:K+/H+ antiporter YhaU regulatory subunit KhtT